MQTLLYKARNENGQLVTGQVVATDTNAARKILVHNKLVPISINPPRSFTDILPFGKRVSAKDKSMFARQTATMIEAGLTLSQSIRLMIRQMKKGKFRSCLENVLNDLQDGFAFSSALAKFPDIFDPIFINVIRSGEATGKLEVVMGQLATNTEKSVKLSGKIKGALMYPAFIMCAMVGALVLMMTMVVPNLISVFDGSGKELPASTKLMIALSHLFTNYWYLLIVGVFAAVVGIRYFFRTTTGIWISSKYTLKMPVVGRIVEQNNMGRFGRLLGMLLSSGVPLLEALHLMEDSFTNVIYRGGIEDVSKQVERGVPMSVPISQNSYFPTMVAQMVAVGEQTGKMDEVMNRLADYYESEVESKMSGISSLIEPVIIVILGVGVAWLVTAILLPIYQISTTV